MERYEPESDFLKLIIAGGAPLSGGDFGRANLKTLIDLTSDEDRPNRDWATFLLSQEGGDTMEVRQALLKAAHDEDKDVRAEAIIGIAQRDRGLALPLVQDALKGEVVGALIFEAAAILAHPSLVSDLQNFTAPSGNLSLDDLVEAALSACAAGSAF